MTHLFFGCSHAITVWEAAGLWRTKESYVNAAESFLALFFLLVSMLAIPQAKDITLILWCLRRRRNEKVWDAIVRDPRISISIAKDLLFEWEKAKCNEPQETAAQHHACIETWKKPNIGEYKCNIDGAIFKDRGIFGIGLCVKDHTGAFVKAKSLWFPGIPTPQEAEAKGLLEALNWMTHLNFDNVTLELDCKAIVDGILGDKTPSTDFGCILA